MMQSFVKAFEARDPKALAAHWTSEGEYRNSRGVGVQGREALERAFSTFFASTPEVSAAIEPGELKFLSSGTAVAEGTVSVHRGAAAPAADARYRALYVREGDAWRLAQLEESDDDAPSLESLAWLIGQWRSVAGAGAEIETTYEWSPNKRFIYATFRLNDPELALSGRQVIGLDPATGTIRSWTFEADGGVGEGDWTRDGDHWVIEAAGSLVDGGTLEAINVVRRIDDDTFTFQSIERLLNDEPLADLPPVKVTRVKAAK